jgi:NtrC-family two-component system sensor histidine kinase KinB
MKIKTKLDLGFGFLFLVVIFFGGIALYHMNKISASSQVILKDNYESMKFVRSMRTIMDDNTLPFSTAAVGQLTGQLQLEANNVTEKGEGKAVAELASIFRQLAVPGASLSTQQQLVKQANYQLRFIDELNMNAIVRKNDAAKRSVERAASYLIFTASMCFIVLFSFIVNFPGFVANPLREFSDAIKEIGKKNYKQHLYFKGNDEFSELAIEFNAMSSQLIKWENTNLAKLQSEKLRIEAIIEQMQDAIIGLNEKNEILFLNRVAGELLNMNVKEVIGLDTNALMKRNDLLNMILQAGSLSKPMKIYADGKESYFQLERREIIVPVYDGNLDQEITAGSKKEGEVFILKNITQYKELDEAKTNFIATVSHELKTPISSIKMSLKLLDNERVGALNDEQKDLVGNIKDDCGRLLKISSELLDLAQVETGHLQLNFVKWDPRKIAVYALDTVRFQAEQKRIELDLITDKNLSKVYVDMEKTTWVLVNFLSNALRYSAEKSKVEIKIVEQDQDIEFSVRDFGKGVDQQYQDRLFDRYFQVPTDGNNKSGSGLGLAISKEFIMAQGGKIWVESEIGVGSRFCFSLPISNEI